MNLSPVVLFVYNRIGHVQQLLESLKRNREAAMTDLFIFSDGPKPGSEEKVEALRKYIMSVEGFRSVTVFDRETNFGLAENIINGLNQLFATYDRLIILEDDLLLSPYFLNFMNDALELYAGDERVGSIHGYIYPVKERLPETFFIRGADCWGWATWKRAWKFFEADGRKLLDEISGSGLKSAFDYEGAYSYSNMLRKQVEGKNSSWAVRWHASLFLRNMLTLYPGVSFVNNQGADASGTHVKRTSVFETPFVKSYSGITRIPLEESKEGREAIRKFFLSIHKNPLKRIFSR